MHLSPLQLIMEEDTEVVYGEEGLAIWVGAIRADTPGPHQAVYPQHQEETGTTQVVHPAPNHWVFKDIFHIEVPATPPQ